MLGGACTATSAARYDLGVVGRCGGRGAWSAEPCISTEVKVEVPHRDVCFEVRRGRCLPQKAAALPQPPTMPSVRHNLHATQNGAGPVVGHKFGAIHG